MSLSFKTEFMLAEFITQELLNQHSCSASRRLVGIWSFINKTDFFTASVAHLNEGGVVVTTMMAPDRN